MTAEPNVHAAIRSLVAESVGMEFADVEALPGETPLFASGVGLNSVSGVALLHSVHERFGVDVAGEDLNLDALESIASLTEFVAARVR